jgi:hypothetical protein
MLKLEESLAQVKEQIGKLETFREDTKPIVTIAKWVGIPVVAVFAISSIIGLFIRGSVLDTRLDHHTGDITRLETTIKELNNRLNDALEKRPIITKTRILVHEGILQEIKDDTVIIRATDAKDSSFNTDKDTTIDIDGEPAKLQDLRAFIGHLIIIYTDEDTHVLRIEATKRIRRQPHPVPPPKIPGQAKGYQEFR